MKRRRKIPTKIELQQLQKLYKTDERIGERLGGVPAYLVAYWRRKKNIPKYSLPKFSENEVRMLWERYGDDEKAGLELGISKAAFYNWRRRYGIKEKPAFLKLEQLELNFPGSKQPLHATSLYGKRTVTQKILARAADAERVDVGQRIEIEPDLAMSPTAVAEVVEQFRTRGAEFVWNAGKIALSLDIDPRRNHPDPAGIHRAVREFARRQNIKTFFDLREGSCQQLVLETRSAATRPGRSHRFCPSLVAWVPGSAGDPCRCFRNGRCVDQRKVHAHGAGNGTHHARWSTVSGSVRGRCGAVGDQPARCGRDRWEGH